MNILDTHFQRAECILKMSWATDEQLQTAFNDLCIYIENTPKGVNDKQLAKAYSMRGDMYAGRSRSYGYRDSDIELD